MSENSIPKEAAYQIINDELMLDGNPRLNLASFVTTWMEPECDKLIQSSINKNYVDMDEYPVTTELQVRSRRAASSCLLLRRSRSSIEPQLSSASFGRDSVVFWPHPETRMPQIGKSDPSFSPLSLACLTPVF